MPLRVVTTCGRGHLEQYAHRWLESRKNWPKDTDFRFYTEGFTVECPGRDLSELPDLVHWKLRHANYAAPSWQWDVVKYSNKVFAAVDALIDHDGIGVWLDADCVTHKEIPEGLIESQLGDAYLACYQRTGMYTETGLWIMNCRDPNHRLFLETWKSLYLKDRFKDLPQWHDCMTLDATIRMAPVKVKNLSGAHAKLAHPQALSELGQYIDHCKGPRKKEGRSKENKFHAPAG